MRTWIMHLVEGLLCCLVGIIFLAIYVSKQTLPRWEPRVPVAPPFRVLRPDDGASDETSDKSDADKRPPVILIHGYASTPLAFPDAECIQPLLAEGHTVVLPTYRRRRDGPNVSISRVLTHSLLACLPRDALPVSIETMAADIVVMMSEQGWDRVHLVGHSMGGMVAQAVAIEVPERIASLTTIGSCTGPGLGPCSPRFVQLLRDGMRVMHPAFWYRLTGDIGGASGEGRRGTDFGVDDCTQERDRKEQRRSEWGQRQVAAIITSRDRAKKLDALVRRGRLHAPVFAVSGDQDTRIPPASAAAMSRRITGCRSMVVCGMGHTPKGGEWTEVLRLAGLVHHDAVLRPSCNEGESGTQPGMHEEGYVQIAKPSPTDEYKRSDVDVLAPTTRAELALEAT